MINIITVTGFISTDIKKENTKNGKEVTHFLLTSKQRDKYITYKVCLWGNYFDKLIEYLGKNKPVLVMGDFCCPTHYVDKNGDTRINLTINAQKVDLLPREKVKEEDQKAKVEEPIEMEPELDF